MNHAIIIYDSSGKIWSIVYGVQQPPTGILYAECDIPVNAIVEKVNVDTKEIVLLFEDGHRENIPFEASDRKDDKEITDKYIAGAVLFDNEHGVCIKIPESNYYTDDIYLYAPFSVFGNADADSVLRGKTFTSKAGARIEGSVVTKQGKIEVGTICLDPIKKQFMLMFPSKGYYDASSKVSCSYDELLSAVGVIPEVVRKDATYLGQHGLAHYLDEASENSSTVFDDDFAFEDNSWEYYAEANQDNFQVINGTQIMMTERDDTLLLQIGIKSGDAYATVPILCPIRSYHKQILMLPVSGLNNYIHSYVNLIITRNKNGRIFIKGLKGDVSGKYRLSIKIIGWTDVECFSEA